MMSNRPEHITKRHLEIINLFRYGLTEKEIADRLFISRKCVSWHKSTLFKVLKIKSGRELFIMILNMRLMPNESISAIKMNGEYKLIASINSIEQNLKYHSLLKI